MAKQKLKWGVISTAKIGRNAVIPAIQRSNNGQVVAVASRNEAAAKTFASELNIPRAYGSYEALLQDPEIDAIYNPLPNSLHKGWTIQAAQAGKHILCEKPLALNVAECDEMEAAADQHNVKLMEAFMYRFHPRTQKVLQLIQEGVVGELRSVQAAFTFRLKDLTNIRYEPTLGGGALMDVGCYCVNVIRTLFASEPIEVQAFACWAQTGVDERLVGVLQFDDGGWGQFECALSMERRETYTVAGTDAYLDVPNAFLPGTSDCEIFEHRGRQEHATYTINGVDEYRLMVEHFAECVLEDKNVRYDVAEARRNMRTIEALYKSARHGGIPSIVS